MPDKAVPPLGQMRVSGFLKEFWQKKPCLLKQAFPGFEPLLDANDIAGLACDELAESRLVTGNSKRADWQVKHGPFRERDLASLQDRDWCLLVQDVEKHYPPLQSLLHFFDFLPSWRLDDLMVSVSAPGGSVGPHVDQYDVFLLQASGTRRWQIAETFSPDLLEGIELKVLKTFDPEQEWVLEAGDVLYLPPGVAHFGEALDLGMTWSIGLRAPSQADLFQALGDWLAEHHQEGERYSDPALSNSSNPGEINSAALDRLSSLLNASNEREQENSPVPDLDQFLASFISRYRLAHQPAPPEKMLNEKQLQRSLEHGARLQRNPWSRLTWIAQNRNKQTKGTQSGKTQNEQALLYACGDPVQLPATLASALCGSDIGLLQWPQIAANAQAVIQLLNQGHLWLDTQQD